MGYEFEIDGGIQIEPSAPSAPGQDVTLSATVKRLDTGGAANFSVGWNKDGGRAPQDRPKTDDVDSASTLALNNYVFKLLGDTAGTYSVRVEATDGDTVEIAGVNEAAIAAPATAGSGDQNGQPAVDPVNLIWDPEFAAGMSALFGLLLIALTVSIGVALFGHFPGNLKALGVTIALWVGCVLLLVAAWVILLEMRGRATRLLGQFEEPSTRGLGAIVQRIDLAAFTNAFRSMRGVLALLLVGLILVFSSLVVANDEELASDSDATTTTTAATTTTSVGATTST